MSIFQSVLARLDGEEKAEPPENAAPPLSISGLPAGFVVGTAPDGTGAPASTARTYSGYFDNEIPSKPVIMPPHLGRTAPQEIAEDLAIGSANSLADLGELRRNFARDNHPDGVHADFRVQATTRMKIANMLIDEAARRLGG
ncbi:hypothetical protein [Pararhizobium sp.]|uniref:hypothetical protein n=1 Tax=Pararhizobium sp. TaxID=1977563 RepID=UPI002716013E|nr:hypothetical protein [Pararhizobium sp.]MDO9414933.1 hypothetical protein [Pararhizobium sp.]